MAVATADVGKEGALLVVSVHDVAPRWIGEVRWLLARLDELGVTNRVLKVVPADEGHELAPDAELADLLRTEQDHGSEIVQHGYTHRAVGAFRGSALDELRARLFAADDAEFLSVGRGVAQTRLRDGRAALERAGLEVRGFCAPSWLAAPWLDDLLEQEGYRYSIGLLRIADFARRRHRTVPAFGYMGAGTVQERLVSVGGDTSIGLHRWLPDQFPHLRAFLHPRLASTSPEAARTLGWIKRVAGREPVTTYAALLDGWDTWA